MPNNIRDLAGQKFGYLTALSLYSERTHHGGAQWLCECMCGTKKIVAASNLRLEGGTRSCGCLMTRHVKKLIGQTFVFLTVLDLYPERTKQREIQLLCKCICGRIQPVRKGDLLSGHTRSCGCKKVYNTIQTRKEHTNALKCINIEYLFRTLRGSARYRGIYFELTLQQVKELTESNCHYCGIEPLQKYSIRRFKITFTYNGLDRKNNNLGYTIDNVVPCCGVCNRAKDVRSYEDYLDWIARSARHIFLQNKDQQKD